MGTSMLRTRWAAIGAAIAITLGAGGVGITQATTSSGERAIYVPIEPCRLADTRPAPTGVGSRSTPLGGNETYQLSGWGTVGKCTLPNGTTGLSLNVTALGPSLPTFLTLFPGDSTLPVASHLNPVPGQPPTPNAVNVGLDAAGGFNIYNLQGAVDIIIDVVGLYDNHTHDDRYYQESEVDVLMKTKSDKVDTYTKTEVNAALVPKANSADVYTQGQVDNRLAVKLDTNQLLSAVVSAAGTLDRGFRAVSAQALFSGDYEVVFDRDVTSCVFTATPGGIDQSVVSGRIVSVTRRSGNPNGVFVRLEDLSGIDTDTSFHLVVVCP